MTKKRHRSEGEERGEWVRTRYMIEQLKEQYSLDELKRLTRKEVVELFDGDPNKASHLNRAGQARIAAISQLQLKDL